MTPKVVLGRGLDALIPRGDDTKAGDSTYHTIPIDKIVSNPMQPRRKFDDEALMELGESFKSQGVLQPIIVKKQDDQFVLIAGERRFRAAGLIGMKDIPAIVLDDKDESDMLQMALVENLQREDLNPLEAAEAFRRLMDEAGLTQNQLAVRVGKSRAAVANVLRLLSLPDKVKELMRQGKLSEGHARAILAVDNDLARVRLAERIIAENMSVRSAEESARRVKRRRLIPKKKIPELMETENYLKQLFGTAVKITPGLKRGKIEIDYYGDEDLERILELFRKIG
jgi:ParB family chromosome partitioning protein